MIVYHLSTTKIRSRIGLRSVKIRCIEGHCVPIESRRNSSGTASLSAEPAKSAEHLASEAMPMKTCWKRFSSLSLVQHSTQRADGRIQHDGLSVRTNTSLCRVMLSLALYIPHVVSLARRLVAPKSGYNLSTHVEAEHHICHSSVQNTCLRDPGLNRGGPELLFYPAKSLSF